MVVSSVKRGCFRKNIPKIDSKRGQVTIFIIIAVLIVAGVVVFMLLRGDSRVNDIPETFQPAYTSFISCIEDGTSTGIGVLQSQAGYIYLPEEELGSEFSPFSSNLDFAGTEVPYWYYVSGSNIAKEQVPTKEQMESHLEIFVNDKVSGCNFENYYGDGFEISWSQPSSRATILDNRVDIEMTMNLNFVKGDESVLVTNHQLSVDSNLGSLYDSAVSVYQEQQESLFLEEYAVDTLRLYAPVDGVEISCSPQTWNANEVFDDLQNAVEANTLALTTGNSFDEYFVLDLPTNNEVRFINSKNWPYSIEVTPSEGNFMIANPQGNQPGLEALGFCYVPYHFVYSLKYPVLVQVYSDPDLEGEFFQFPVAVILENNNPRESLVTEASLSSVPELCLYKDTHIEVRVRDKQGVSIPADISYECLSNKCNIGTASSSGVLNGEFPQCANGFVTARAQGFKEVSYSLSTISSGSVTIIMDRVYEKPVQLVLNGVNYNGEAIIYFTSEDSSRTLVYPEQRSVELSEGEYEVQVYIYDESSITFPESITEQCVDVPRSGFLGFFGFNEERCFDVEIPEQVVSQVLSGGGSQNYFVLESDLLSSSLIEINVEGFELPETLDELQYNNLLVDESEIELNFV